jgi:glycosyltransferase involved in cell wall biosynthesis
MSSAVAISICIPAYRNTAFLKRLLDSIASQTFTDYEIIITDDSPDDSVGRLIQNHIVRQPVRYYKNKTALGTPENWNEAIRHANGAWIKLMHTDDWFHSEDALNIYFKATQQNPECTFFFAAFQNVTEDTGKKKIVRCTLPDLFFLWLSPLHLFKRVYVGNPSCTLVKREVGLLYDSRYKFVVDFEYYLRCFQKNRKYKYIDKLLINVCFHEGQVTKYTFLVPDIQIPENLNLLEKLGLKILRNPVVYDYYWRMFRNLNIRDMEELRHYYSGNIPALISSMVNIQSKIPASILRNGVFSKALMMLNYFRSLIRMH